MEEETMTGPCVSNILGYTCDTMAKNKIKKICKYTQIMKFSLVRIDFCNSKS